MPDLAYRLNDFDSSVFREVVNLSSNLKDPIDLSVGLPEEMTHNRIKLAGIESINNNHTKYTPANGVLELRQKIVDKLYIDNSIQTDTDSVSVVPGLTTGLLLVYLAILNPGDEVIVFDPCYPPYSHLPSLAGAQSVLVSTLPTYQPDLPNLRACITNKTKAIVVNSPNNPTGAIYDKKTLEEIASIAKEHDLFVISDEIYEYFNFGKTGHFSIGSIYPNTITMNGFSKSYAMTGWRLGYISGPREIVDAVNQLQQYTVFSSSSIAQHAAIEALKEVPNIKEKYQEKRKLLIKELKSMGYEINGLEGAFFAYLKAPNDMTDIEFFEEAVKSNLIVVPGRAFSTRHGYFRISYGTDIATLRKGVDILRKLSVK